MFTDDHPGGRVVHRTRLVAVSRSRGRIFLGRSSQEERAEVTATQLDALLTAGFEVVEFGSNDVEPLCLLVAAVCAEADRAHSPVGGPPTLAARPRPGLAWTQRRSDLDLWLD
jgi:hypothetical protein